MEDRKFTIILFPQNNMRLTELKGIGDKTEKIFEKAGINDVTDLLLFFPRDYEKYYPPVTVGEIGYKNFAAVRGAFVQNVTERRVKNLKIAQAVFKDETGESIRAVWFNAPFMKNAVDIGIPYVIRGRISRKYGVRQIDQPKIYRLAEYDMLEGTLQPKYSLTRGLTSSMIRKAVKQALESPEFLKLDDEDIIPEEIRKRFDLVLRSTAVKNIHFPENDAAYISARRRLAFEEIFVFIYLMKKSSDHKKIISEKIIRASEKTSDFLDSLPYELTPAQKKVIREIDDDMSSGMAMNRLIQGDVGSGKTIVALAALMNAAYAGYQGALMAPTEVLAAQHYEKIQKMFKDNKAGLNAALITGSMTALEKRVIYDALENGRIDILIGTHAIIQEKVRFKDLALVITDEQHRFGIRQREALSLKSDNTPHMMVMSATPIPRTLALILYGNMDVSIIDQMPSSRKPVKNAVVDSSYHENAVRFISKQIEMGHQAYIICPLVEYSDGMDAANVEDYTEMLREEMDPSIRIGKLTGKMSAEKKTLTMNLFVKGEIDVLVSTTVIEVGVDVPNATVMMVEDANRFGLAALHQLRGRVGRGPDQSYCIFVSDNRSEEAIKRLEILNTSNNGFEIASKDLEIRGPGEVLGTRQSGELNFSVFDMLKDTDIAIKAENAADDIINGRICLSEDEKTKLEAKSIHVQGGILL